MKLGLKGKVVVITGASSGIGAAMAREYAADGACVVLGARQQDKLRQIVEEIEQKGGKAAYAVTDVTSADDCRRLVETAVERFGGIDAMICNAGLSLRAELTLPIFSINVGLGRNIIANGPDTRIFYQTLALKAHVWRNAFIQVGYQLSEFHLPNNLMFGLGYTFGRLK